ncbi:hypothetical protein SteCoe_18019 [Stentor coeruleus]|uniref:Uncharacterized protein n=1 Tax=Stentor coeruleus TaxID=5963 RepID=A0A1R2BXE6_9CILI|nr:hypothetical protein SteCoe_18019 [Stentor coeruleus]
MNLNKGIPNVQSEKAAVKTLIEQSALDTSPLFVAAIPELEKWVNKISDKKKNPSILPLPNRAKSSISKQPIGSKNMAKCVKIVRCRISKNKKSSGENKIFTMPMVSLFLNTQVIESNVRMPPAQVIKLKIRSRSLTDTKNQVKPINIMNIKRAIDMIIRRTQNKEKIKENIVIKHNNIKLSKIPKIVDLGQILQPKFL